MIEVTLKIFNECQCVDTHVGNGTRKASAEAGIRRNAICYNTWN